MSNPHTLTHTPGPWCVENGWLQREKGACVDGRYFSICVSSTTIADIHLIAAAPDLLEALSWALAEIDGRTIYQRNEQFDNCWQLAHWALAKATGADAATPPIKGADA